MDRLKSLGNYFIIGLFLIAICHNVLLVCSNVYHSYDALLSMGDGFESTLKRLAVSTYFAFNIGLIWWMVVMTRNFYRDETQKKSQGKNVL